MDLAYQGIHHILDGKKFTVLFWLWTLSVAFSAVTSNAQEPAEQRKWIGWGAAYGSYEQDDLKAEEMEGELAAMKAKMEAEHEAMKAKTEAEMKAKMEAEMKAAMKAKEEELAAKFAEDLRKIEEEKAPSLHSNSLSFNGNPNQCDC